MLSRCGALVSKQLKGQSRIAAVQHKKAGRFTLPQTRTKQQVYYHCSTSTFMTNAAMSGQDLLSVLGNNQNGNAVSDAMEALANADAVCFDVDSTVITEEGIDVLADSLGKGQEVAELTASAMSGSTKFEDALEARLSLLQPSKQAILDCLEQHPLELSPGVEEFIEALHEKMVDVYLVSGGFRIMIEPVAKALCVSKKNIVANTILFDSKGDYAGFDSNEPTSADMGKHKALKELEKEHGYETMVMVGDGATDAQAKPPARAFIGFGGIVKRPAVQEKACWYVHDFADMTRIVTEFHKNKK